MFLTDEEKHFVRENKTVLKGLFQKGIEELKEDIITAKQPDRDRICDLIVELKYWLIDISILEKDKIDEKKDNFI